MLHNCELPLQMLDQNYEYNSCDFVLFHLYSTNAKYRGYYEAMRTYHRARFMILDNSAYEYYVKGQTLDLSKYRDAIESLNPDFYILPDVLMDKEKTIACTKAFLGMFQIKCKGKPMAVLQGNTPEELIDCMHEYMEMGITAVCIPFHNRFFYEMGKNAPHWVRSRFTKVYPKITDDILYAMGRVMFITEHEEELGKFWWVHILGSHCPLEKTFYRFESMDTGYPVKLGIAGQLLETEDHKPDIIIDDFLEKDIPQDIQDKILHNIKKFSNYSFEEV